MARKHNSGNNRRNRRKADAAAAPADATASAASVKASPPAKSTGSKKVVAEKSTRSKLSPEERVQRNLQDRVSSLMRRNEDTFKAVCLVMDLLAADASNKEEAVDSMWSKVTRYDKKYFTSVYKKRRNASNPLRVADVKSPSTAYAFFTKETYSTVKEENPTVQFGDVSKIIRKMWSELSDDDKKHYTDLAAQDSARYHKAKTHVYGLIDGSVKPKSKSDKELYARLQANVSESGDSSSTAVTAAATAPVPATVPAATAATATATKSK